MLEIIPYEAKDFLNTNQRHYPIDAKFSKSNQDSQE